MRTFRMTGWGVHLPLAGWGVHLPLSKISLSRGNDLSFAPGLSMQCMFSAPNMSRDLSSLHNYTYRTPSRLPRQ